MQTRTKEQELQEILRELLPPQGRWDEAGYLWLSERTNQLLEFTDGSIEVLPMATPYHQAIVRFFFLLFHAHLQPLGGNVHFAPLRLRIREGKFREPDVLLLLDAGDPRQGDRFWYAADLVLEVVSEDGAERDLVEKVADYAQAGIPEYWVVNPPAGTITVLRLEGDRYVEHGVFRRGARATSALLPGFAVDVAAAFDAR